MINIIIIFQIALQHSMEYGFILSYQKNCKCEKIYTFLMHFTGAQSVKCKISEIIILMIIFDSNAEEHLSQR